MNKKYWWFMVVIVFVAGLMISNMLVQAKENTPVIQWEYKTVRINYMNKKYEKKKIRILSKDLSILNEHGKDGWELCGVNNINYYFKREIRE
jgi:type II secretory pathway component PulF